MSNHISTVGLHQEALHPLVHCHVIDFLAERLQEFVAHALPFPPARNLENRVDVSA
jgi:hypothetical protein